MDTPDTTAPANSLSPQKWAETIKAAIEDMRYRESKYRRESSDALLMAETLTDARQNLESALYKAGLTK